MKKEINFVGIGTRILAIVIFAISAISKFAGVPLVVGLFQRIGADPVGRYTIAALECVVIVLLLIPKLAVKGAMLGAALMFGAIFTLSLSNDNTGKGIFFAAAIAILFCCVGVIVSKGDDETHEVELA